MRLLLSGDVHIGRIASRLPEEVQEVGITRRAWMHLIETAVRERVQAVLISGDLVDQSNGYLEAIGALEAGLTRLQKEGIQLLIVAGNHDANVLPRVVQAVSHFTNLHFLGSGGVWERLILSDENGPALAVDAWSFPGPVVEEDPCGQYDLPPSTGLPVLGVLHGDLDQTTSRYAPLSTNGLRNLPVDAWLLGHIHVPQVHEAQPWILYPGSPLPMDPGESGAHGTWICEVQGGSLHCPRFLQDAKLRYDTLTVHVNGVSHADQLIDRISTATMEFTDTACTQQPALETLSLRVKLVGELPSDMDATQVWATHAGHSQMALATCTVFIESLDDQTDLPVDLDAIQRGRGAAAALAQILERDPSDYPPELRLALDSLERQVSQRAAFTGLSDAPDAAGTARIVANRMMRKILESNA